MKTDVPGKEIEYFECRCSADEHALTFSLFNFSDRFGQEPELFVHVFLETWKPWYKRVWTGIRYIFGHKCRYGHFDEFLMQYNDSERFLQLAQKFHNEAQKYKEKHPKAFS